MQTAQKLEIDFGVLDLEKKALEAGRRFLSENPGSYTFAKLLGLETKEPALFPPTYPEGNTNVQFIAYKMSQAIGGYGCYDEATSSHPSPTDTDVVAIVQQALNVLFRGMPSEEGDNGTIIFTVPPSEPSRDARSRQHLLTASFGSGT